MGRELRRVPLDFSWPLNMRWRGYLNPYHSQKCEPCDGEGVNPATKQISDDFYDHRGNGSRRWADKITQDEADALVAKGRGRKFVGGEKRWEEVPRTAEEFNVANRWGASGLGDLSHDAINRWTLIRVRATRLGVYGQCPTCGGDGEVWATPEIKAQHEAWKSFDPPTGEGFQLWETTSEGSPVSPVFASLDALCAWAADNATTFGSFKATAAEWKTMLAPDGMVCHREGNAVFL